MSGIRIYEVLVFGIVPPVPEARVDDTVSLIRRQTIRVFEEAVKLVNLLEKLLCFYLLSTSLIPQILRYNFDRRNIDTGIHYFVLDL